MTSILTNVAAMTALQTLRSIGNNMEETQARVSSGLRVAGAADNAAYWSIATTMRSDNLALSAVQDALGLGAAKVDTAYGAMDKSIEVVKQIKAKLVAATEEGIDKAKIQEELTQLQDQLRANAQAASFSGENWVVGEDAAVKSVVSGFVRASDDTISVKTTTYTFDSSATGNVMFGHDGTDIQFDAGILGTAGAVSGTAVIDIALTDAMTPEEIGQFLSDVETALSAMTSAAAELGSITMRISMQEDFVQTLTDSIDKGIGRLVDADMNEESTRLKALQTQQQLGIQSLSIANSSSEGILQLFR